MSEKTKPVAEANSSKIKGEESASFDEALRRMLNAPPQHKVKPEPKKKKKPAP